MSGKAPQAPRSAARARRERVVGIKLLLILLLSGLEVPTYTTCPPQTTTPYTFWSGEHRADRSIIMSAESFLEDHADDHR
jgi:hypothetical protein